ncbi:MAG TPA: helix-turn-helix domain-containing protein [Lachnospiraceae bacterium]|nr:helix-turn-helix domain-containing protein [Lachnospiraceae bacterium]
MISNQVIQISISDLHALTKVEIAVLDLSGTVVASTFSDVNFDPEMIATFASSPADSQIVNGYHWLKISDESEVIYILVAKDAGPDVYIMGKIAVNQIQNLMIAYKERFDRNNFFQNLLLDNLLLVDIFNRAKKLHIEVELPRAVFLIQTKADKNSEAMEMLKSLFSNQSGDYITSVDESSIVLIKTLESEDDYSILKETALMIVDMMNSEAMMKVKVSWGNIVTNLKSVSKSYKEAKMAMDVGKIFYVEKEIMAYNTLGIGRLIYQLPINLCRMFIQEIFGDGVKLELDEEMLSTINKFFENNLNVSETSRQLFVHRNTLVYRIEKLEKSTGLDIRTFDDALTFKIALMVVNYMKYLDHLE